MKTARNVCIALLALFSVASANAASLTPDEFERVVFLSMLLDPDYDKSRIGVRILGQRYPENDEICDHVAEKLLKEPASNSGIATDAISWYVRTLADNCKPRYVDTLALVRQRQTHKKIVEYLDLAQAKPAASPAVAQYKEGSVDLLTAQIELLQMLSGRQQQKGAAAGFAPGATLGDVLYSAGIPRELAPMTLRIARYGRKSVLSAHYDGTGLLLFTREGASQWVLADVLPEMFSVGDFYKGPSFGVAQSVATLRGQAFRMYVKSKARAIRRDRELLWVLTHRLANSPFASDKFEADGLMVGVEVIAGSRHPEAIAMLKQIAASPGESVPKRAGAYVEKLQRQGPPPPVVEPEEPPDEEGEAKEEA